MSIVLSVFGAVSAWLIQDVAYRTHLRGKVPVYIGFVCILIWLLLGWLFGRRNDRNNRRPPMGGGGFGGGRRPGR